MGAGRIIRVKNSRRTFIRTLIAGCLIGGGSFNSWHPAVKGGKLNENDSTAELLFVSVFYNSYSRVSGNSNLQVKSWCDVAVSVLFN